jgi:hypothetical protein
MSSPAAHQADRGTLRLRLPVADRVLLFGSPGLLVLLGALGLGAGGSWVPGAFATGGVVLLVIAGWSVPWFSDVDAEGVRFRAPLRDLRIGWDDVVAFERHRGRGSGALIVRTVGRRRFALTTKVERPDEWDALNELARRHAPGVAVADPPPLHPFSRPHRTFDQLRRRP